MSRALTRSLVAVLGVVALVGGFAVPAEAAASGGSVHVQLFDEAGGLLIRDESDIRVSLYRGDDLATPELTADMAYGSLGELQIDQVPAGRYAVKFEPGYYGLAGEWWGDTRRAADRAFITVDDGGTVDLEARLSSTVRITGLITGRQTDYPTISDVSVAATTGDRELDSWLPYRKAEERLGKSYSLRVLPGVYTVTFTPGTRAHHPKTVSGVVASAATATTLDVALKVARASISGTWAVRTADGVAPFRYGYHTLYKWSATEKKWLRMRQTAGGSSDTAYLIDNLDAGRYKLAFDYEDVTTFWGGGDLRSAPEIVLAAAQTATGKNIVVDEPAQISGVVVERHGGGLVPFYGAFVTIWRQTWNGGYVRVSDDMQGDGFDQHTFGDGTFEASLRPGTYVLRAWEDEPNGGPRFISAPRYLSGTRITVGRGEQRDVGKLIVMERLFLG